MHERVYDTALLYLELPSSISAVAISLVDFYNFTESIRTCQFPFPTFWGIYVFVRTVYTRPSFPPTLIMADGLWVRLLHEVACCRRSPTAGFLGLPNHPKQWLHMLLLLSQPPLCFLLRLSHSAATISLLTDVAPL